MIRNPICAHGLLRVAFLVTGISGLAAAAFAQQAAAPSYTPAEYNAYIAASKETNPQQRITELGDFVAQFPSSTLLPYVYQTEYQTYGQLKDYPHTITYADKLLALGDKADPTARLQAYIARAQAFYLGTNSNDKTLAAPDQLTAARTAAADGQKALDSWQKPASVSDEQYAKLKKSQGILFQTVAGVASLSLKDYPAAVQAFKATLALDPTDPLTYYHLGVADLQQTPPAFMDGAWALARAIALKIPDDAKVKTYLQGTIANYEGPVCDNLIADQVTNLLQLAAQSPDRPATFTIPSADDLTKARQNFQTIPPILDALQAGGDNAKTAWLSVCGLQFPQVPAKVISVTPGTDSIDFQLATGATDDAMQAATAANIDAKVVDQPEASRLQKDDVFYFGGTLVSYDPTPLVLHFDKCKIDPANIPEAGKHTKQLHHK